MILGILLGAIYWYSGSLWAAIIAHFFYDAALIILAYIKPELITQQAPAITVSTIVLALISPARLR